MYNEENEDFFFKDDILESLEEMVATRECVDMTLSEKEKMTELSKRLVKGRMGRKRKSEFIKKQKVLKIKKIPDNPYDNNTDYPKKKDKSVTSIKKKKALIKATNKKLRKGFDAINSICGEEYELKDYNSYTIQTKPSDYKKIKLNGIAII